MSQKQGQASIASPSDNLWDAMNPRQRNDYIGGLMQDEPLTQCWIYINGRRFSPTVFNEKDLAKAEDLAEYVRGKGWKEFSAANSVPESCRDTIRAQVVRWYLRYSDTPRRRLGSH